MKNNKFTLLAILSICVFIFSDCFLLGAKGEFKYADIKTSRKGKVLIGFIENRDLKYSPYNTKNLTDLLKFEIMNQGYEAYTIDDKPQQAVVTENSSELKPEEKSPEENTNGIRNIAGESDRNLLLEKEGKLMKGSEIVSLSKQVSFDYFVQGAIGNTDDGRVLSRKESSFLILDLFDKTGNKVGGIRFASEDKIMADINLIKDACLKIAGLFGKENQPKPNRFFIF